MAHTTYQPSTRVRGGMTASFTNKPGGWWLGDTKENLAREKRLVEGQRGSLTSSFPPLYRRSLLIAQLSWMVQRNKKLPPFYPFYSVLLQIQLWAGVVGWLVGVRNAWRGILWIYVDSGSGQGSLPVLRATMSVLVVPSLLRSSTQRLTMI